MYIGGERQIVEKRKTRDSVVNCRTTDPIQNYILCLNRYVLKNLPYPERGLAFALCYWEVIYRPLEYPAWQEYLRLPAGLVTESLTI